MLFSSTDRGFRFISRPPGRQRGALSKPLLALGALAILGASATAITYLVMQGNMPFMGNAAADNAPAKPAPAPVPPPLPVPLFLKLDAFTVTIANPSAERLLHVGVVFTMNDEPTRKRLTDVLPIIRSRILLLLAEQNPDDINTSASKMRLERAIRHIANESVDTNSGQKVVEVLFTDFVVQ